MPKIRKNDSSDTGYSFTVTENDMRLFLMRYSSPGHRLCIAEIMQGLLRLNGMIAEKGLHLDKDGELTKKEIYYTDELFSSYDEKYVNSSEGALLPGSDAEDSGMKKQVIRLLNELVDAPPVFGARICSDMPVQTKKKKPKTSAVSKGGSKTRSETVIYEQAYYARHDISDADVNIIRDAITVFPYAEQKETKKIVSSLNRLTHIYNRGEYDENLVSAVKYPGTYYKNLSAITEALSTVKLSSPGDAVKELKPETRRMRASKYKESQYRPIRRISFTYCDYNEQKKLVTRKHKADTDGNGEPVYKAREYTVDPVKLMWTNGFYYLVTYNEKYKSFSNYRVDRMKNVKCLDEEAKFPEAYMKNGRFDHDKYKAEHPVMYTSGSSKDISIRCDKFLINNAMDTFGSGIAITPESGGRVMITLRNVNIEGVIMWMMEYGEHAEALDDEIGEEIKRRAKILYDKY